MLPPFVIFHSYAREDVSLLSELSKHLASLKRENWIEEWFDGEILPGQKWDQTIKAKLAQADIVLCLVSPDFINSQYCWETEVEFALAAQAQGDMDVIPVIVRPADWSHSPLGRLQALPSGAIPVTASSSRDAAWLNVAQGVRRLVRGITQRRLRSRIAAIAPDRPVEENRRAAHSLTEEVPGQVLATAIDDLADCFCRMRSDPFTQYRLAQAIGACATDASRARVRTLYTYADHDLARRGLDDALNEK